MSNRIRSIPVRLSKICSEMINGSIAFLDSGVGGLPYLEWLRSRRPDLNVVYVADSLNFPYGERSPDEVRSAVLDTAGRLLNSGTPRIMVVACNTASVAALSELRAVAPCPVVGTVPAVKPAALLAGDGAIGVLATRGTAQSAYLDQLINAFAPGRNIVKVAAGDIVRFVEEHWLDEGESGAIPVLERALKELKASRVSSVVMGCTHFLHVLKPISEGLGPDVQIVDSRDGVGRRIFSLLNETDLQGSGSGIFMVTRNNSEERHRRFAARYGLEWKGVFG